jgi:hypothetical protein
MTDDLEERVSALEQKLDEADEAHMLDQIENTAYLVALVRILERAGLVAEGQMAKEVARAKEELAKIAEDRRSPFLSLLLRPSGDPSKLQ